MHALVGSIEINCYNIQIYMNMSPLLSPKYQFAAFPNLPLMPFFLYTIVKSVSEQPSYEI